MLFKLSCIASKRQIVDWLTTYPSVIPKDNATSAWVNPLFSRYCLNFFTNGMRVFMPLSVVGGRSLGLHEAMPSCNVVLCVSEGAAVSCSSLSTSPLRSTTCSVCACGSMGSSGIISPWKLLETRGSWVFPDQAEHCRTILDCTLKHTRTTLKHTRNLEEKGNNHYSFLYVSDFWR